MFNVKMEEAYLAPIEESTTQFRAPVTQAGLVPGQDNSNTKSNTKWSLNVFEKWRESRSERVPDFHLMNSKEMSFWLEQFVVEVKKLDGTEYPSKSIYLILCGLHRHLRDNGIYDKNFLDEKNVYFARFRKVLNARMRTLNEKGLGLTVKRADPILPEQEDKLWEKGVFGQGSGEQLQLTIFFYVCKLFGLRTREDHHLLNVDQFSVGEDGDGRFINFVGRSSKTDNKGESGQLSVQSKSIKYYSKPGDRCIIDMFDVYLKAVGEEGSFYRRLLPPEGSQKIRFAQQSLGINKLKNFMKVIAERGELIGNFTILSGTRTGDMHQRHVLKDFQNKK